MSHITHFVNDALSYKSFEAMSDTEKGSIKKLTVNVFDRLSDTKTINLEPFVNLIHFNIDTNARFVITGLNLCLNLKSAIICGAKIDNLVSSSLEKLVIRSWHDPDFDPTGCPNLQSITIELLQSESRDSHYHMEPIDISKLSGLMHLTECHIIGNVNIVDNLKSNSITTLTYTGLNDDIVFEIPKLKSYQGKFNISILNSSVSKINFSTSCSQVSKVNQIDLRCLDDLTIAANDLAMLETMNYGFTFTKLKLILDNNVELTKYYVYVSIIELCVNDKSFDISGIINRFPSLDKLVVTTKDCRNDTITVNHVIIHPIRHIVLNSMITVDQLQRFNTSKLDILDCRVPINSMDKINIKSLTKLYCNKFILDNGNAPNLTTYHGPLMSDIALTNVQELGVCNDYYHDNYAPINFFVMPKLKTISGNNAENYIVSYITTIQNSSSKDCVIRNIDMLSNNMFYYQKYNQLDSKLNGPYHYIKNTKVSNTIIRYIVDEIGYRLQLENEIMQAGIIAKMNAVFERHQYDDGSVIAENLFKALDGKFGITAN